MYKNYAGYKAYKSKQKKKPVYHKTVNNIHIYKQQKTHPKISNYYVDKKGDYKEKPHFANFWKHGFLNDVPTRADYNREMDGIKYTDSVIHREDYPSDEAYKAALQREEHDHLYGLERIQMSIMRLWNGSPREILKLLWRVLFILGIAGLCALMFI